MMTFMLAALLTNQAILVAHRTHAPLLDYQPPVIGPWRTLAELSSTDDLPRVTESLNEILTDKWLDLTPARAEVCDAPCATGVSSPRVYAEDSGSLRLDCQEIRTQVSDAKNKWLQTREIGLSLGEALDQFQRSGDAAAWQTLQRAHEGLQASMNATRGALPARNLIPVLNMEFSWQLSAGALLVELPADWRVAGSGFTVVRKSGRVLASGEDLHLQVSGGGEVVRVNASLHVSPVQYCAGDATVRIEGVATYMTGSHAGGIAVPLPLSTSVALIGKPDLDSDSTMIGLPGDL